MPTFTIPKQLSQKGELAIIPKKEYEELKEIAQLIDKEQLWFWTKEWQKRTASRSRYSTRQDKQTISNSTRTQRRA